MVLEEGVAAMLKLGGEVTTSVAVLVLSRLPLLPRRLNT
jgi:hypothetical protein